MKTYRVLHLGKYYPPAPGGIESHVQTLARGQVDLGHEVSVICVNHADKNGVDITHSRWRRTPGFKQLDQGVQVNRVGRLFGISRLEVCPKLVGTIRDAAGNVDIVHVHTPNPLMLAAWLLAGEKKTALVVTHHSDVIKQRLLQNLVAPIESRVYKSAQLILSDSPNYIDGSSVLQKFRNKVDVLPLGIDLEPFINPGKKEHEEARQLKACHGSPLWLMVGRMTYYKGYHVALEALSRVKGRLIVVGNGPLEAELKATAQRLGVNDRIVWMPSVSQKGLVALYHAATALWFPSIARSEGFGLVQVEAMACGCPVINTDIAGSGVSWVSQNNVSGLTVAVGDIQAFVEAANRIQYEADLRKMFSKGAQDCSKGRFDAKLMASKSVDYYSKII